MNSLLNLIFVSKYYTPNLNEFKQGFKFEFLDINDYRFGFIDFSSNNGFEEMSKVHTEEWKEKSVDWKYEENKRIILESGGNTLNVSGSTMNFFSQFSDELINKYLKDGKIRAKK